MPTLITYLDDPAAARRVVRPPWLRRAAAPFVGGLALGLLALANLMVGLIGLALGVAPRVARRVARRGRPRVAREPEDRLFDI